MNPTTSTRFNALMPRLIRHFGLRAVGGKGGLDRACADAMKEVGCVYLSFLGGGAPILSDAIKARRDRRVERSDRALPAGEAARSTTLGPLTVAIDAHGNTLYDNLQDEARQKLPGDPGRARSRPSRGGESEEVSLTSLETPERRFSTTARVASRASSVCINFVL